MERKHLAEYTLQNPHGVYQMNQNICAGHGVMSGVSRIGVPVMYTLVHNVSLHYSGHHKRWMSAGESLAMLGFPIYIELANVRGSGARCCSFAPGGSLTPSAPSRTRNKKIGFAGNSQHVAVNVFMKIYVLLFARRAEQNQQHHPISQIFRA